MLWLGSCLKLILVPQSGLSTDSRAIFSCCTAALHVSDTTQESRKRNALPKPVLDISAEGEAALDGSALLGDAAPIAATLSEWPINVRLDLSSDERGNP